MFKATALVSAAALSLAVAALAGSLAVPEVPILVTKATKVVRAKPAFSKAVLLEADGTSTKGKVKTSAGITKWRFVFNNQLTPGSTFRSVFVNYSNGHFGSPVGNKSPFVEDRNIVTPPKMTLATAIAKLRAAGYRSGFFGVTLRYPLGPGFTETLYIFTLGSQAPHPYVSVGTKTGKVKPLT